MKCNLRVYGSAILAQVSLLLAILLQSVEEVAETMASASSNSPDGSRHATTAASANIELVDKFKSAQSTDDKLLVMFQTMIGHQSDVAQRFTKVDERMDTVDARMLSLERRVDAMERTPKAPEGVTKPLEQDSRSSDGPVHLRRIMCIGGLPKFTDGDDMRALVQPLLNEWGAAVVHQFFPAVGRVAKVTFSSRTAMWTAIEEYKMRQEPLTYEGCKIWANVDLKLEERNHSRKMRIVMDLLREVGPEERLRPKWSSSEILRVTGGQSKGVLCKVDTEKIEIQWEALSDTVLSNHQKMQLEVEFGERAASM